MRLSISVAIGGVFAWVAARGGLPLVPAWSAFAGVTWWAVPAYGLSLAALHFLRANRFRLLVARAHPLRLREILHLNFIGFFAIFVLPLRLGELVRPALGKSRYGIPISTGLGTIAVERVVDGLITSLCVASVLALVPSIEPDDRVAQHLPHYAGVALTLFGAAFAALAAFHWQRDLAIRMVRGSVGLISQRWANILGNKISGIADGLSVIGNPRLGIGFVLESCAYWCTNALGVWLLGIGCGLPGFGLSHAFAVVSVLAIGILLPAGPGLFGTFQLAVVACLYRYYPGDIVVAQGAVFVFLLYVLQGTVICLAGLGAIYFSGVDRATLSQTLSDGFRRPSLE